MARIVVVLGDLVPGDNGLRVQRFEPVECGDPFTSYERAVALDPGNASVLAYAVTIKQTLGELDDAIAVQRRAMELDPVDVPQQFGLSSLYLSADRIDEAIKAYDAIPTDQRNAAPEFRVYFDLVAGRIADAASAVPQVADPEWQLLFRAMLAAHQSSRRTADSLLTAFVDQYHSHDAFQIAQLYAWRGAADSAFVWLDRAYAQRDQGVQAVKTAPFLKSVRADPRFATFLAKMRLPP